MTFSLYDPNDRYRRRAAKRTTNMVFLMIVAVVIYGFGVWTGTIKSRQNVYILQEEKRILSAELTEMQNEITALRANSQTANVRFEQLKASYEEIISGDSPIKNLVNILKNQIEEGVDPERIESILLSAKPPQNCSDAYHKRFVVITPVYSGPTSSISIGNGDIIISATGESATTQNGKKQAWFDPGKPVDIMFKKKGEENPVSKKGVLPIYYSETLNNKQYRMTVSAGAKSFAKVTYDYCDAP